MTAQAENPKPNRKKLWVIIAAVVVVVVIIVGTLTVLMNQSVSPPAVPASPNVIIWNGTFCNMSGNCGFVPNVRNVTVGTTVTWTNNGGMTHTVTTCDSKNPPVPQCPAMDASGLPSIDSRVAGGTSFSYKFTVAGTYYYYCKPHPWMQGEIIVN
jgi:nitrite reductase (NO-forming)